jgi:glycosyltransferase involved in cell wall biosynthesis
MAKTRILFISHESSLTGATILLINLINLVKKSPDYEFTIVIKRGGKLDDQFAGLAPTIVLKPEGYQENKSFLFKVMDFLSYKIRMRKVISAAKKSDVIFSNTIANGRLLKELDIVKKPTLVYVHELKFAMDFCNRHFDTDLSLKFADVLFVPSPAVAKNLEANHQISSDKILPLNYYFPFTTENETEAKKARRSGFFRQHQIPEKKFHVAGMGAAVDRKGIDLFVEVCREVNGASPEIHFTWIGGFLEEEYRKKIMSRIEAYGLKENITITGYISHSSFNLLPFDLFLLTSREDPYPLVVLEAAFLKIPAIAFRGTGGMEDFIGEEAGFLVDNLSITEMSKRVLQLENDPIEITKNGEAARRKALTLHADPDLVLEQLNAGLSKLCE